MNPEFRRNIWLELTPRRLLTMTVVLVLVFFAAALSGSDWPPAGAAKTLYYFIVVLWGARNAALSVVGEIRDRTWDSQRLSALSAGEMVWGKLFGATIFNWYGGAICLAVVLVYEATHQGPFTAVVDVVYFVAIGVIAQSVALLASLVAVLRRQTHSRLEIFGYQAAGLVAAIAVFYVWEAADPAGSFITHKPPTDFIPWWGHAFDARGFLLLSLAAFAAWTFIGCYREMRVELKLRNGVLVWLGFLLFMGVYVAGFDAWLPHGPSAIARDMTTLRLALMAATFGVLTYAMVLLEPKDLVLYRWLGAEIGAGRILRAANSLQGWMMSYLATFAVVVALIVWLLLQDAQALPDAALAGSAMGFLTRDVAIFVLLQALPGPRRGDFTALVVLFSLYVLTPAILAGLGLKQTIVLFYPQSSGALWPSPAIAWAEAVILVSLVVSRLAAGTKPAVAG